MRLYRPIGILKTQFQCIVHAQGQQYKTIVFTFDVFVVLFKDDLNFVF
jgi:hypothetical protein